MRNTIDTSFFFIVGNKNNCDSFNSVDFLKELGVHWSESVSDTILSEKSV